MGEHKFTKVPKPEPIPEAPKEPPKPEGLVCPHCNADPCTINARDIMWPNGLIAMVFSCQACRSIFSLDFRGEVPGQRAIVSPHPFTRPS
jgi:hypothetical protein